MSLFGLGSKATDTVAEAGHRLANRFVVRDGIATIINGAIGTVRKDSTEAIKNSIKEWAKIDKDVIEFAQEMENLNPKHLGLAHDIIDLAHEADGVFGMKCLDVNLKEKTNIGKTWLGYILSEIPKISRENPAALDMVQAIINETGEANAKFFIQKFFGKYDLAKATGSSKHMTAVKEIIPVLEKDSEHITIYNDPYFEKRNHFLNFITNLLYEGNKPENIKLLTPIKDIINKSCKKTNPSCYIDDIAIGNTEVIKKNMDVLPYLLKNAEAQGKNIEISGFLTKNVNLD